MKRIYSVGDKFVILGIKSIVLFVNKGFAWVGPLEDTEASYSNRPLMTGLAFTKLDSSLKTPEGTKAFPLREDLISKPKKKAS